MTDKLQVSVSGKSIYRAVANYLNGSTKLQSIIDGHVEKIMETDTFKKAVQDKVNSVIASEVKLIISEDYVIGMARTGMRESVNKTVDDMVANSNVRQLITDALIRLVDQANKR
jgi:hypothetical protein